MLGGLTMYPAVATFL